MPFLVLRGRLPALQGELGRQRVLAEELKPRAGGHGVTLGGGRLRPGPRWGGVWHLPAVDRRKWEAESWPLSLGASAFGRPGECALPMFPLPPARGTSLSRGCDKPSTESEPLCAGQPWPFPARLQWRPATRSFRFGVLHQLCRWEPRECAHFSFECRLSNCVAWGPPSHPLPKDALILHTPRAVA